MSLTSNREKHPTSGELAWNIGFDIIASNYPFANIGERVYRYFAPQDTSVSAHPILWASRPNFIAVLEFPVTDFNSHFYYVPRSYLLPGMH